MRACVDVCVCVRVWMYACAHGLDDLLAVLQVGLGKGRGHEGGDGTRCYRLEHMGHCGQSEGPPLHLRGGGVITTAPEGGGG